MLASWLWSRWQVLQIYTIRHVQLHMGELGARLSGRGIEIGWVGAGAA